MSEWESIMPTVSDFMYGWKADGNPKPNDHNRKERRKAAKIAYKVYKKTQKALKQKNQDGVQSKEANL